MFLIAGLLVVCLCVVFGIFVTLSRSDGVTKSNFDRIEKGMTRAKVEEIFGGPSRAKAFRFWDGKTRTVNDVWYEDDGDTAFILFEDEFVIEKRWKAVRSRNNI